MWNPESTWRYYRARIEVDATPGKGALVDLHLAAELGSRVHIEVMGR